MTGKPGTHVPVFSTFPSRAGRQPIAERLDLRCCRAARLAGAWHRRTVQVPLRSARKPNHAAVAHHRR